MILLFTPKYEFALLWCREQDPPVNPHSNDVRVFFPGRDDRVNGRYLTPEDRVVIVNANHVFQLPRSLRSGWMRLMDALKAMEHSSPEWDRGMRERWYSP